MEVGFSQLIICVTFCYFVLVWAWSGTAVYHAQVSCETGL